MNPIRGMDKGVRQQGTAESRVCSGGKLRSNNDSYVQRTQELVDKGMLTIYQDLEKMITTISSTIVG